MRSSRKPRSRRAVARVAVAGALVAVPLTALAVPAFADDAAPAAANVDWQDHDRWQQHRHDGPWDGPGHRHDRPGPGWPGPGGPLVPPPTGSFG
ncbi:hypothetical protein [Nocardia wallacei]|uniref:hypothetical protein n=1 Tax=Nocardia wallacei TaxID=480035 RepID=UPI00245758A5|nr:hypothetical protein [Nocardia wallacei]